MEIDKILMNDFKQYIREKEKQFEARLRGLEYKNRYNSYIGQKFGTKTILGTEAKKSGSRTRTYFLWKCDCGIEGKSQYDQLFRRTPKCMHKEK